jgi:hypothetical protein
MATAGDLLAAAGGMLGISSAAAKDTKTPSQSEAEVSSRTRALRLF